MSKKGVSLIYLHPKVADNQWSFLHRFFHPGIRDKDGQYVLLGTSVDISHHSFLSATVLDFLNDKGHHIYIPHGLVCTVVEVGARKTPLGFQDLKESPELLE